MKRKAKVITYGQLRDFLDHLIQHGERSYDEPIKIDGSYFEYIEDVRRKELTKGSVEVEIDVPPLKL